MQLKWTGPIAILMLSFLQPCKLESLKFVPIYEALTIRANKSSPPHIAFEEIRRNIEIDDEWSAFNILPTTQLASGPAQVSQLKKEKLPRLVLNEMVIAREPAAALPTQTMSSQVVAEAASEPADQSWMQELSAPQQKLLQMAQQRSDVLSQDWSQPTWSDEVRRVLQQSGVTISAKTQEIQVAGTSAPAKAVVKDSVGVEKTLPESTVGFVANGSSIKTVSGPVEIAGGLALTNDHYIEIRRSSEGVVQEAGRFDLRSATYSIDVAGPSGAVVARLITRDGQILGEGSVRLSHLDFNSSKISGPTLKIAPVSGSSGSGVVASFYKPSSPPPKETVVTMLKGARDFAVKKDGAIPFENMARGSSTVVRAAAPSFMQTSSLVVAGENFNSTLFPESMVRALREIVLGQKQDQTSAEELGNIVWGKVSLDGKSLAGIKVEVEGLSEMQPIYFNQFLLPDPNLTATGDNGLYAFVEVPEGFHSLAAHRESNLFGYQNVVVEKGAVAVGDIQNSIHVESVPVRIFDAFTGSPVAAELTLQSVDHPLNVDDGADVLLLPQINRLGLLRAIPGGNDYLAARYLYSDKDAFIHLPMVSWSWLSNIKTYLKINEVPDSGIAVGFVHDEAFEAYVAGEENFAAENIVYFDMQGRILQNHKGIAGGGFIIYNLPADTQEIVVVGGKTQKIYSRAFPVDANSLSVLSFRE